MYICGVMPFTQEDLNAVNEAIGSGARIVKYGDKEVTYANMNDLRTAKAMIEAELNRGKRKTRRFAYFIKD